MRGFLASSIGVTCAAALALPLTLPAAPAAAAPGVAEEAGVREAAGSTQSLPLAPLTTDRVPGSAAEQGLPRRDVRRFSLVGVVWEDPDTELHGRVQVRTRAADSGDWSEWQDLESHTGEHAADPGTSERASDHVRGATAPLWVGESDGVEVRVRATEESDGHGDRAARSPLPSGLRLELVDPGDGEDTSDEDASENEETSENEDSSENEDASDEDSPTAFPGLDSSAFASLSAAELEDDVRTKPKTAPRPRIVSRSGWGADEKLRERKFVYTKKVKAAFVHHSATGNNYSCSQAPSVIRGIYRYHVKSMGWRDIGYNFVVDKCGNIYEGRAGGVTKPVMGAHTLGFNTDSMGIAVLGTFDTARPSKATVKALGRLTAWKLGLHGGNPRGKTYLKSGGGNLYRKGKKVRLNVISGHRDGFATQCPGRQLYAKLGSVRGYAAYYQGRD
ncbi:peptidoglycan recognition protein [Streptomyces sp. NPDC052610]|uniref:peptidoglycan recognition protein family protein n=1 Tax=Streptomyces sp. NPDC052610 TaxID=3154952 RepID=UPI003440B691